MQQGQSCVLREKDGHIWRYPPSIYPLGLGLGWQEQPLYRESHHETHPELGQGLSPSWILKWYPICLRVHQMEKETMVVRQIHGAERRRSDNRLHTLTHCQTSKSLINDSRTIGMKQITEHSPRKNCEAVNIRMSSRGGPFHVDYHETRKLITLNS